MIHRGGRSIIHTHTLSYTLDICITYSMHTCTMWCTYCNIFHAQCTMWTTYCVSIHLCVACVVTSRDATRNCAACLHSAHAHTSIHNQCMYYIFHAQKCDEIYVLCVHSLVCSSVFATRDFELRCMYLYSFLVSSLWDGAVLTWGISTEDMTGIWRDAAYMYVYYIYMYICNMYMSIDMICK